MARRPVDFLKEKTKEDKIRKEKGKKKEKGNPWEQK